MGAKLSLVTDSEHLNYLENAMSKMYYGLTTQQELISHIRRACQVLSPKTASQAAQLMIGTACTESNFGTHPDFREGYGFGWAQFDRIRVKDVASYIRQRDSLCASILSETGLNVPFYDTDTLCHILKFSPLVSAFFCRVGYMQIPEALPAVGDIEGQAHYYKKFWNSYHPNAKGSVEKYLADWQEFYAGKSL